MEWNLEWWILLVSIASLSFYWYKTKETKKMERKKGIPRGSSGWPLVGETLDFIACGYTSKPVSFMDKRKSL